MTSRRGPAMYSVAAYGKMIADRGRMEPYVRALEAVVFPGATVLDIGTGTGILALVACRLGASRVYAVEPDPAIEIARENAAVNGYADRIRFFRELSTRVRLPERVDVVVSDLRGVLPLFGHHIPAIADARERHLKPGGALVPMRDVIRGAVVSDAEVYASYSGPWDAELHGMDLSPARRVTTNTWGKERIGAGSLLTAPAAWAELDYRTHLAPSHRATMRWTVERDGMGHGVVAWFDAELAPGIGFSNAPGSPRLIYGGAFFPWREPVALRAGDDVTVELRADLVGDEYVWSWNSTIRASPPVSFRQSTFSGSFIAAHSLRRGAHDHVATLDEEGEIAREALLRMDGRTTLRAVAEALRALYPRRFARWEDAMARVAELSRAYGA
ncbi:MAG TPA: 50S ribosomal protein L11 methyltransferase [Longimicrobium sp.]|nr:50S ribosomal protein L11 methyltransferase [Longimicrobium sp.]